MSIVVVVLLFSLGPISANVYGSHAPISANLYGSHAPISANLYGSHAPISANHGFSTIISNLYGGHGFASPYGPCGGQPFTTIGKHIICTTR